MISHLNNSLNWCSCYRSLLGLKNGKKVCEKRSLSLAAKAGMVTVNFKVIKGERKLRIIEFIDSGAFLRYEKIVGLIAIPGEVIFKPDSDLTPTGPWGDLRMINLLPFHSLIFLTVGTVYTVSNHFLTLF